MVFIRLQKSKQLKQCEVSLANRGSAGNYLLESPYRGLQQIITFQALAIFCQAYSKLVFGVDILLCKHVKMPCWIYTLFGCIRGTEQYLRQSVNALAKMPCQPL